jgi:hypothetical protein
METSPGEHKALVALRQHTYIGPSLDLLTLKMGNKSQFSNKISWLDYG